jgi:hypothetical protein
LIKVLDVAEGTLVGFKEWPNNPIPSVADELDSETQEWSAIYPQLTLTAALAYLPNQWERGHKIAHIISLTTKKKLTLLLYPNPNFSDPAITSAEKAVIFRNDYSYFNASNFDCRVLICISHS